MGPGATTHYYLPDGLGSTMALVDSAGAIVSTYHYDVFGAIRSLTGTQGNEFKFTGEQVDSSTGLEYLRARYYDQATGRFVSRDSLFGNTWWPGSQHLYAYVESNPILWGDPTGHVPGPVGPSAKEGRRVDSGPEGGCGPDDEYDEGAEICVPRGQTGLRGKLLRQQQAQKYAQNPTPKPGSKGGPGTGKPFTDKVKRQVYSQNPNRICVYCGGKATQVDHAYPQSRGGNNTFENGQLVCGWCNASKGSGLYPKNPPPGYVGPGKSWWR